MMSFTGCQVNNILNTSCALSFTNAYIPWRQCIEATCVYSSVGNNGLIQHLVSCLIVTCGIEDKTKDLAPVALQCSDHFV